MFLRPGSQTILTHTRHLRANTLKWTRLRGPRKRKAPSLSYYDIVITTYETLVRQRKKHMDTKVFEENVYSYAWHRIVLDEGKSLIHEW